MAKTFHSRHAGQTIINAGSGSAVANPKCSASRSKKKAGRKTPGQYSAQEMRDRAVILKLAFFDVVSAAMLRQAADMMEREEKREKKYEYAQKFITESVSRDHHDTYMEARGDAVDGYIVRREVGEWEDAQDGE